MRNSENIEQIINLLQEILRWVRFYGWKGAKETLIEALPDDIDKLIFQLSDGSPSRDIAEKVGMSKDAVITRWRKWARHKIQENIFIGRFGIPISGNIKVGEEKEIE